jgi:hypothetical protein
MPSNPHLGQKTILTIAGMGDGAVDIREALSISGSGLRLPPTCTETYDAIELNQLNPGEDLLPA